MSVALEIGLVIAIILLSFVMYGCIKEVFSDDDKLWPVIVANLIGCVVVFYGLFAVLYVLVS